MMEEDNSPLCIKCPFGDDYDCYDCTSLEIECMHLHYAELGYD